MRGAGEICRGLYLPTLGLVVLAKCGERVVHKPRDAPIGRWFTALVGALAVVSARAATSRVAAALIAAALLAAALIATALIAAALLATALTFVTSRLATGPSITVVAAIVAPSRARRVALIARVAIAGATLLGMPRTLRVRWCLWIACWRTTAITGLIAPRLVIAAILPPSGVLLLLRFAIARRPALLRWPVWFGHRRSHRQRNALALVIDLEHAHF